MGADKEKDKKQQEKATKDGELKAKEAEQKDKEKADKAEKQVKAKEKAFKQNGNEKAEKALIAAEKKSKTAEHVFAAAQDELEKEEGNEEENAEKEEKQVCQVAKDQMKRVDLALVSLEKAKLMVRRAKCVSNAQRSSLSWILRQRI